MSAWRSPVSRAAASAINDSVRTRRRPPAGLSAVAAATGVGKPATTAAFRQQSDEILWFCGVTFCPDSRWNSPPATMLIFSAGRRGCRFTQRLLGWRLSLAEGARRRHSSRPCGSWHYAGERRDRPQSALSGSSRKSVRYGGIGSFGPADLMQLVVRTQPRWILWLIMNHMSYP
jgi:hypothetical protein